MNVFLALHILAGAVGLASGAIAMAAPKGGPWHRKAGVVFTGSMLAMAALGTVLAARSDKLATDISVMVGILVFYLVGTSFLAVRKPVAAMRRVLTAGAAVALGVAAFAIGFGLAAAGTPTGKLDGLPPMPYYIFGSIALLAAIGDMRLLRAGAIAGVPRLARHLWRMGVAMLIATMSFFFGQARLFPEAVRDSGVLAVPIVVVLLHLVFWMVWVRVRGRRRAMVAAPSLPGRPS